MVDGQPSLSKTCKPIYPSVERFLRRESEKDGYPAGTHIEHDGEIYVFRMVFARG